MVLLSFDRRQTVDVVSLCTLRCHFIANYAHTLHLFIESNCRLRQLFSQTTILSLLFKLKTNKSIQIFSVFVLLRFFCFSVDILFSIFLLFYREIIFACVDTHETVLFFFTDFFFYLCDPLFRSSQIICMCFEIVSIHSFVFISVVCVGQFKHNRSRFLSSFQTKQRFNYRTRRTHHTHADLCAYEMNLSTERP